MPIWLTRVYAFTSFTVCSYSSPKCKWVFFRAPAKYIGVKSKVKCFVDDVDVDDGTTIDWLMTLMFWTWACVSVRVYKKREYEDGYTIYIHTPTMIGEWSIAVAQATEQSWTNIYSLKKFCGQRSTKRKKRANGTDSKWDSNTYHAFYLIDTK